MQQHDANLLKGSIDFDSEHIFVVAPAHEVRETLQREVDFWIENNTYAGDDVDEYDININPDAVIKL